MKFFVTIGACLFLSVQLLYAEPPFASSTYLIPGLLTEKDQSVFENVTYLGLESRLVFDRRIGKFIDLEMHILNAEFSDISKVEIRVNPEFTKEEAIQQGKKYLFVIGQLPLVLREDIDTVTIHGGNKPLGGGSRNILIHTDQAEKLAEKNVLEETMFHEATHTSMDKDHFKSRGWIEAQKKDGEFFTKYAKINPWREDVASTFLMYFALRVLPDRVEPSLKKVIEETVPARLAYFDSLKLDMFPIVSSEEEEKPSSGLPVKSKLPTEVRAWTSTSGKTLQAKLLRFVDREKSTGEFQREDGRKFNIKFSEFSIEDQTFVSSLATQ